MDGDITHTQQRKMNHDINTELPFWKTVRPMQSLYYAYNCTCVCTSVHFVHCQGMDVGVLVVHVYTVHVIGHLIMCVCVHVCVCACVCVSF